MGHLLTDVLELHFLEMPRVAKTKQEVDERLIRWLLFLQGARTEELHEMVNDDPMLQKAMALQEQLSRNEEEWLLREAAGLSPETTD